MPTRSRPASPPMNPRPRLLTVLTAILIWATLPLSGIRLAVAQESPKILILPGERLTVAGRHGFIFWPPEGKRSSPQPWVMYAPTLEGYPDNHERWMHERFLEAGIAV